MQSKIRKTANLQLVTSKCLSSMLFMTIFYTLRYPCSVSVACTSPLQTVFKRKKKTLTCLTGCDYISKSFSFSLSILPYSGFEEPMCAAAMCFDLSILCPRASADSICSACTVWERQRHPFLSKSSLFTHQNACAASDPAEAGRKHSPCVWATRPTFGHTTFFLLFKSS